MNSFVGLRNVRQLTYIGWNPLPKSWLKINSDGSVHNEDFAALIRDSAGQLLRVFTANVESCLVTIAKL